MRLKFGKIKICQEQNILTFVYNKAGADSSEWFEPAEGAGNLKKSSHRAKPKEHSSSRHKTGNTAGRQPSRTGKSSSKLNPLNPVVPSGKAGSSSQVTTATNAGKKEKKVARGAVYIITMKRCVDQPSPPFAKVGQTSRTRAGCKDRVKELQTGNPHKLICKNQFFCYRPRKCDSSGPHQIE